MKTTTWLVAIALIVFAVTARGEVDSKAGRERLLRDLAGEPVEREESNLETLGTSELLVNGGFEAGQAPGPGMGFSGTSGSWAWTTSDGMLNPVWTDPPTHTGTPAPRTGAWCVYFTPFGPASNSISQQVAIPSGSAATLSFWVKIGTFETSSSFPYDTLSVRLTSPSGTTLTTLATYSNLTATPGFSYVRKTFDVSAWAGQTVTVRFSSYNDSSRSTVFLLDDVSLSVTTGGSEPPGGAAGTWVLPSSARVQGASAFWKTDLVAMNTASDAAIVTFRFLGHDGSGAGGPERTYTLPARSTATWPDVLSSMFGRETDWGPILIRSSVATLAVQGQTWTASPAGGTYGQGVPAIGPAEMIGTSPKAIAGIRQDGAFRTNLVLANVKDTPVTAYVALIRPDGTTSTSRVVPLGPYGFSQLNVANDLGVSNIVGGSLLVHCTTAGGQLAVYASVIDSVTADPRTILPR
jgi:hypothetical protein